MSVIEQWRLTKATEAVEAVMVLRYRARPSEETTDQARTMANAALVAIDDCRGAVSLAEDALALASDALLNGRQPRMERELEVLERRFDALGGQ